MNYNVPIFDTKPAIILTIKDIEPSKTTSETNTQYVIKAGDSLTKIGEAFNVPISRLWSANPQLTNPDLIEPDKPLNIPQASDVLVDRPLPTLTSVGSSQTQNSPSGSFSVSGNSYTAGNCTWLVKNLRPELPNNLGNASSWFARASNEGLAVSLAPRVGAVAVAISYGHVALVESIHGSTISIIEMNYRGFGITSHRDAPISEFRYIL